MLSVLSFSGCSKNKKGESGPPFELYELAGHWNGHECLDGKDEKDQTVYAAAFITFSAIGRNGYIQIGLERFKDAECTQTAGPVVSERNLLISIDPVSTQEDLPVYKIFYRSVYFQDENGNDSISATIDFIDKDTFQMKDVSIYEAKDNLPLSDDIKEDLKQLIQKLTSYQFKRI